MPVFVSYDGPKLGKKQKQVVRSQVMILVRDQQKKAKQANKPALEEPPRPLAPAPDKNGGGRALPEDEGDATLAAPQAASGSSRSRQPAAAANSRRSNRDKILARRDQQWLNINVWDLRGAPPKSTHMTGIDARTFQEYLCRCGSYTSYLDEGFALVGFRQPSYFRPDLSKAACIYIGWLWTAGVLDASRGTQEIAYPYFEYQAVRELQKFIDGAGGRQLHEVVYPVVILAMFELFRFSPRAITHLAAVENFIKTRGGLQQMPDVMQHIVIMADTLQCLTLGTPLAFSLLGPAPIMRLMTADGFVEGDELRSCPLLLCDKEDFSLAAQYVDPAIHVQLVAVLRAANDSFRQFFLPSAMQNTCGNDGRIVDALADSPTAGNNVPRLLLDTCAFAARIMRRTLSGYLDGFEDPENTSDLLAIYHNTRFMGLKAWAGLPYVYVWVILIGFAASPDRNMKHHFVAEVVRCAFSYGCYQMEVFQAVIGNFLHLRDALAARKMALARSHSNSPFSTISQDLSYSSVIAQGEIPIRTPALLDEYNNSHEVASQFCPSWTAGEQAFWEAGGTTESEDSSPSGSD
ncbi:hypothetical protein N657DRAFT_564033 [Parathielavia appendiculata]|uniref:Uncharacterized protein n=1 Tax=Parathielavia appendiculata TaxID=2587402 RepID=A0AAN6UAX5_9PEZI|nr:hypothetical protein N657DRAFT_564033 [Parathielavia appendiculata]